MQSKLERQKRREDHVQLQPARQAELQTVKDVMDNAYRDSNNDLDDLLGELGISLN